MTKQQTIEKFLARVEKTDACWLWTGPLGKRRLKDYGYCSPVAFPDQMAHRTSYILFKGPIPTGKQILHTCDTPRCVNPSHLYAGTAQQNVDDRLRRGRSRHFKGEENKSARLTNDQVREIRSLYRPGLRPSGYFGAAEGSVRWLALKFGVCKRTIQNILQEKNWSSIT